MLWRLSFYLFIPFTSLPISYMNGKALPICIFTFDPPSHSVLIFALNSAFISQPMMTALSPYLFAWSHDNHAAYEVSNLSDCARLGLTHVTLAFYVQSRYGEIYDWKQDIIDHKGKVDVGLSVGGASGGFIDVEKSIEEHVEPLVKLIMELAVSRLDLDIEGSTLESKHHVQLWVNIVKQVVDSTNVEVTITLPVEWNGLGINAMSVVQNFQHAGVPIRYVNLMMMDFFTPLPQKCRSWADKHIEILQIVHHQLQTKFGLDWINIGYCPMIGENDDKSLFTLKDWNKSLDFVLQKKVGLISFWAINRDQRRHLTQLEYGINTHSKCQLKDYSYIHAALNKINK